MSMFAHLHLFCGVVSVVPPARQFKLIADLDLLPLIFGTDWRFIYLQKLTGTVTIVPDAPLWAYLRVISDPNYTRMQHYLLTGEKATWSAAENEAHTRIRQTTP
jgi:hypothetical protein